MRSAYKHYGDDDGELNNCGVSAVVVIFSLLLVLVVIIPDTIIHYTIATRGGRCRGGGGPVNGEDFISEASKRSVKKT